MTHQLDKLDVLLEFGLGDSDQSHLYNFIPSNLAADRNITLPLLTADDTFVFANASQTLINKTIIGGTGAGDDLTFESTSNGTKGDIILLDTVDARNYIQLTDIAAPSNGIDTTGRIYKKTGSPGLFWLADSGEVEVNLATVGGVSDHGLLTGLGDDDHSIYSLLLGRSGGQTLIGGTASGDDLTFESTSNATKGDIILLDTVDARNYIQLTDISAPSNGADTTGRLYKKTGSIGLFWLADSGETEVNLATVGGVSDHGALAGLGDDDHTIYSLLLGRSGGQTLIGGTAASNDLTLESTSNATKGDIILLDTVDARNYIQLTDITAPSNGVDTTGRLYKKTGDDGLFWLPDSGGAEIDLTDGGGVSDHGALTGLADDDHTIYSLLLGRSGGQTLIGGTASGDDLTFESTSNATKGDIILLDTVDARNYIQFTDIAAPSNGVDTTGRLYKKTSNDGLFWLPDSGGAEIDLTSPAASLTYQTATATASTTTTSASYIVMPTMTITVGATGTYTCTFSASGNGSVQTGIYYYAFHVNGTPVTHSERQVSYGSNSADNSDAAMHSQMITAVSATDVIAIYWFRAAAGTFTVNERSIQIIKVA